MVGLKTYHTRLIVGLFASIAGLCPGPAHAAPLTPDQQVQAFASCAGRYSALTEHLWLVDGPASEGPARRRDAFGELMQAALPDSGVSAPVAMGWRVAAKVQQRALLAEALFQGRRGAAAIAAAETARCDRLLPGA